MSELPSLFTKRLILHLSRNPASGKVMQKLGMKAEGFLGQRVIKWGIFEDVVLYAILSEDGVRR